ncbi:3-deoxy-manno-octulosonate cytidylyltransferase [Flavitalea flava]
MKNSHMNEKPVRRICLIPARYDASRFPGKLLKPLAGKTVIRATYERIASYKLFDEVAVVTNSEEIKQEIENYGGKVFFFKEQHTSGTDRIAQALKTIDADVIVNVQGDEPFVDKKPLEDLLAAIDPKINLRMVGSLMRPMDDKAQIESRDFVKVVCDKNNFALYFSRSVIPFVRNQTPAAIHYEHIGVYIFTRAALLEFAGLAPTALEQTESVECLRFLENGIPIKMIATDYLALEIDTETDLKNAEELIKSGKLSV